jgi:hypothetical protein
MVRLHCCLLAGALLAGAALADDRTAGPVQKPRAAASASAAGDAQKPLQPPASEQDCRRRRQEYLRSQACFARFRNAPGGIKPEAFAVCGPEVLDPSVDCPPPRYP